jgi:chaperonin GroES
VQGHGWHSIGWTAKSSASQNLPDIGYRFATARSALESYNHEIPPTPRRRRRQTRRRRDEVAGPGGIFIPDTAGEKPQRGEVVAVGPGGRDDAGKLLPIDLKAGNMVLFGKWSGTEVKIDGKDLLIMKESDIMGVLE